MESQQHWNSIYQTKSDTDVSWFENEPRISLELIKAVSPKQGSVIDVGGGASRLVDALLAAGFGAVTVLDISTTALERAKTRLGDQADRASWVVADITQRPNLGQFELWHDRAVFHFLTDPEDRRKYVESASQTVRVGGHLIIGTFALDGPEKCSGLEICQYDSARLCNELRPWFQLLQERRHVHVTPAGKEQQFIFCVFQRVPVLAFPGDPIQPAATCGT